MDAEHAPEGRLVTPNTYKASLGTHVVTSLGSYGAWDGVFAIYSLFNPHPKFAQVHVELVELHARL